MKTQIRRGVFETNSSSVHSLTMCMKSELDKWKDGELVYDRWNNELVPITDEMKQKLTEVDPECHDGRYYTYDQFFDWEYIDQEKFEDYYKTPNGEEIVAFGYYGHD